MKKGTRGTHYKAAAARKTVGLYLRLSEADLAMIRGKAEAAGLSVTEYVVTACAARRVPGYKAAKTTKPTTDDQIPGQMDLSSFPVQQDADACHADADAEPLNSGFGIFA